MEIDDALVVKLASLSKLHFTASEMPEIKDDLRKMIGFINKLNELNTDAVQPVFHMTENTNIFREDAVVQPISREQALMNSPLPDPQYFKVPRVIKK